MEEDEREGKRSKVRALIEKATNSTLPEVDPRLLAAIKTVVRYSDSELRIAVKTLLVLMRRDHSQVRYLALLIIDQLFMRSKLFRNLIVEEMDTLLTLSVGFRKSQPLPDPPAVATCMRSKAIEFLEKWNDSFGVHYRQIRLGFDYLKNTLRLQFPNLQANAARIQRERQERDRKSKEIVLNKYENLKQNFALMREEIECTVREIREGLDIVRCGEDQAEWSYADEEDFVEFRCPELRQIRLSALEEGEKVHENSENKAVFDALRELYKLVVTKHLVSVQDWVSVLVRVDVTDSKCRDSILKEVIDIKNELQAAKKECDRAGFSLRSTGNVEGVEEDFWEEGIIGSSESGNSGSQSEGNKTAASASTSSGAKSNDQASSVKDSAKRKMLGPEDHGHQSYPLRGKLLAKAPVVDWGSHLDNWGSKRDMLANQRGLELEGHWGRVDYDAVIPAEKIAELSVQATMYREKPVKIQPCNAPLKKGGLCARRDLRVCPFHGPIIPRDEKGNPIGQDSSKDETTSDPWIDLVGELGRQAVLQKDKELVKKTHVDSECSSPRNLARQALEYIREKKGPEKDETTSYSESNLVEQLARQAVKNLRERDREAARNAQMDKRALKRAKLAKIREHNESVLKEAALASTSRSANIGENTEANNAAKLTARNKKQGLASMLRKKVTAKDRISKRLSKGRTSETTVIQLSIGEDAKYREAFPNQW